MDVVGGGVYFARLGGCQGLVRPSVRPLQAWNVALPCNQRRNFEPVQCSEDPSHSTTVSTTKSDPARFIAREDSSLTPSDADGSSYLLSGRPTALPGRGQISLAIDATSPTMSARVFFVQDTCLFLEGISFSKESLSRRNILSIEAFWALGLVFCGFDHLVPPTSPIYALL
jgi:hypothetical protein